MAQARNPLFPVTIVEDSPPREWPKFVQHVHTVTAIGWCMYHAVVFFYSDMEKMAVIKEQSREDKLYYRPLGQINNAVIAMSTPIVQKTGLILPFYNYDPNMSPTPHFAFVCWRKNVVWIYDPFMDENCFDLNDTNLDRVKYFLKKTYELLKPDQGWVPEHASVPVKVFMAGGGGWGTGQELACDWLEKGAVLYKFSKLRTPETWGNVKYPWREVSFDDNAIEDLNFWVGKPHEKIMHMCGR
ncbi:hypothetical protein EDC01DRAFT_310592 [Geopyxis carbonaria]|nr:hypothetical protein EDC01DRAFT_310592 [Geopyxis carbonaria]